MEEKRKKFVIEMLPSLHHDLKQAALDRKVPLWSVTQSAIEQWLANNPHQPRQVEAKVDLSGVPPDLSDLFMEMVAKIQSRPSRQALPFPRNYSEAKPRRPRVGGGK